MTFYFLASLLSLSSQYGYDLLYIFPSGVVKFGGEIFNAKTILQTAVFGVLRRLSVQTIYDEYDEIAFFIMKSEIPCLYRLRCSLTFSGGVTIRRRKILLWGFVPL